jgi:uncharacterized protein
MPHIKALTLFPIKGCRGIPLQQAFALPNGLAVQLKNGRWVHDRQFMVVDSQGLFITQREVPSMATISVLLGDEGLVLRAPNHPDIEVPACKKVRPVIVWSFEGFGLDAGPKIMAWLSSVLQRPAALVEFSPAHARQCKAVGSQGSTTLFADSFAYLLISQASVSDLEQRMREHHQDASLVLPPNRFRANVLIDGVEAYEEDLVQTFAHSSRQANDSYGQTTLEVVSKCVRCNVPGVDQHSGEVQLEAPTALLDTFRLDLALAGSTIGVNAILASSGHHLLQIGDNLTVEYAF